MGPISAQLLPHILQQSAFCLYFFSHWPGGPEQYRRRHSLFSAVHTSSDFLKLSRAAFPKTPRTVFLKNLPRAALPAFL